MIEDRTTGIGLLGLDDTGHFLRDLIVQNPAMGRLVAAWDPSAERRSMFSAAQPSLEAVLQDPRVDRLYISGPLPSRFEWTHAGLVRGKSTFVVAPIAADPEHAGLLISASNCGSGQLAWLRLNEDRGSFLSALRILQSGRLGRLRSVRYRLRHPPALVNGDFRSASGLADEFNLLETVGGPLIDQLVRLCESEPQHVYCTIRNPQLHANLEGGELILEVGFKGGVTARIEVDRRTCQSEHPGWIVEGERGAWKEGRITHIQDDGEIYDLAEIETRCDNHESDTEDPVLRGQPFDVSVCLRSAAILNAAKSSALARRIESL